MLGGRGGGGENNYFTYFREAVKNIQRGGRGSLNLAAFGRKVLAMYPPKKTLNSLYPPNYQKIFIETSHKIGKHCKILYFEQIFPNLASAPLRVGKSAQTP